jgi:H+/Cl- antiporter ClcA
MFKSIQISLPKSRRHTLDPKFILVLFFVEVGSLIFNSLHLAAPELHVYNAYNEIPVIYHISSKSYSCFSNINYCVYEDKQMRFLKVLDMIFISIILICYGSLFIIILRKWENIRMRSNLRITWYAGLQLLVLFALALHTLLMIILVERNALNANQCNEQNLLIRVENLFNYFVLSILEVAYIGFNLVNRQVLSIHTPQQEFEYGAQAAEHLHLPSPENDHRVSRTWN